MDRIDIHVEVPAVNYEELTGLETGESSADIRERVLATRQVQQKRFSDIPKVHSNADMGPKQLRAHCELDTEAEGMLKMAINELNFSARAFDRILKVSRTIADLEHSDIIRANHVGEAIQYRTLDRQFWT